MLVKSFKDLKSSIEGNKLGNFIVIHGNEKDKIKESELYIKSLVNGFPELNLIEIAGNNIKIDDIKNACETVPVMSDNKVVCMKIPFFLLESDINSKNLLKDILSYSKDIPEYTVLLISHFDLIDKSNPILKAAQGVGTLVEYKIPTYGKELSAWIEVFLKEEGKTINKSDSFYLSSELSSSIDFLQTELEKLISYVGDRETIDKKDIDSIIHKSAESNIFKMADYMFKKNARGAIDILDTLTLQGEQYPKIMFMIIRQFRIFYSLKLMLEEEISEKEIMKELKLQEFAYRGMVKLITTWDEESIRLVLEDALNTDYSIKSGKISPELALEMLILRTCK